MNGELQLRARLLVRAVNRFGGWRRLRPRPTCTVCALARALGSWDGGLPTADGARACVRCGAGCRCGLRRGNGEQVRQAGRRALAFQENAPRQAQGGLGRSMLLPDPPLFFQKKKNPQSFFVVTGSPLFTTLGGKSSVGTNLRS